MKVMGSALMVFEAIVIGLAIPVAVAIGGYSKTESLTWGFGLIALCFIAIGGFRRDRRTALVTGWFVQLTVIIAGLLVRPFMTPAVIFTLVWILAIVLSAKTDLNKSVN